MGPKVAKIAELMKAAEPQRGSIRINSFEKVNLEEDAEGRGPIFEEGDSLVAIIEEALGEKVFPDPIKETKTVFTTAKHYLIRHPNGGKPFQVGESPSDEDTLAHFQGLADRLAKAAGVAAGVAAPSAANTVAVQQVPVVEAEKPPMPESVVEPTVETGKKEEIQGVGTEPQGTSAEEPEEAVTVETSPENADEPQTEATDASPVANEEPLDAGAVAGGSLFTEEDPAVEKEEEESPVKKEAKVVSVEKVPARGKRGRKTAKEKKEESEAKADAANADAEGDDEPTFNQVANPAKQQVAEFTLDSSIISSMCQKAIVAVPSSPSMESLTCFKFVCADGSLNIESTNLETTVSQNTICEGEFDFTVNAKKLLKVVKMLNGHIRFRINNDKLEVSTGTKKVTLKVGNTLDFPNKPHIVSDVQCQYIADNEVVSCIQRAMEAVVFGVGTDRNLKGIHFVTNTKGDLLITSTNKQIIYRAKISKSISTETECLISNAALKNTLTVFKGQKFAISIHDEYAIFKANNDVVIYVKLLECNYPQVDNAIALNYEQKLRVSKSSLLGALGLLGITANTSTNECRLHVIDTNTAVLSTSSIDEETAAEVKLESVSADFKDFKVALNINNISSALQSFSGEEVKLEFQDHNEKNYRITSGNDSTEFCVLSPVVMSEDDE